MLKERKRTLIIALAFLILQIFLIIRNSVYTPGYYDGYFFFCNFSPILFAIFFFYRKYDFINGLIYFSLLSHLCFFVTYITRLIYNTPDLNLVGFSPFWAFFITLTTYLIHSTSFVALFLTRKIKPNKKSFMFSIFFMLFVYILTLLFTNPASGINYVYSTKKILLFDIPHLTILWPFLALVICILPGMGIKNLVYNLSTAKKRKRKRKS
jgi:hypothetical protein